MSSLVFFVCSILQLLGATHAIPAPQWLRRDGKDEHSMPPYSLPRFDNNPSLREAAVQRQREGYQYAPAVAAGPLSVAGSLGGAANDADTVIIKAELAQQLKLTDKDWEKANATEQQYDDLATLEDYVKLYDNEWLLSSSGQGPAPGLLTNYTQDLLFSMERLSINPYALRRLNPDEGVPFEVPDTLAVNISSLTASQLLAEGRLFYVDHRNQSTLERKGQYSANCDALFYISPLNGDFLPLAIRTNVGSNLIYTSADTPEDWLLAKMMFNENDFFMGQWDHFARSHFVIEAVNLAALRTLSESHPLSGLMKRFAYAIFGFRPIGLATLIKSGAAVDKYFGLSGAAAGEFSNTSYFTGYAGAVQANYFYTNLKRRGLIGYEGGPELKHFPFYEDAAPIYNAIRAFTGAYCQSYYHGPDAIAEDTELQAWLAEAEVAQVIDFPTSSSLQTVSDLADLMAYIGHIISISHHAVNLNQLLTSAGVLPFHPTALYKPIPESKGVTDVASFLPNITQTLAVINFEAKFARPLLAHNNRTLVHMFDSEELMERSNFIAREANDVFKAAMLARSEVVSQRSFGPDGLSQGMPFVWKALDPDVIPWNMAI